MNSTEAFKIIKKVLAADFACKESDFDREGVFIHEAKEVERRRRFPIREKSLNIATMGTGVVVSCSRDRLRWAKSTLTGLSKDEIFSESTISQIAKYIAPNNQIIRSPDLKYICIPAKFKPFTPGIKLELSVLTDKEIMHFFKTQKFSYAIGNRDNPEEIHIIAISAVYDGRIAGIAAASADCDEMYQVGVDVLPEYQKLGIGKAVVSRVTEEIFKMGKLPYYSTWASNLASRRLNIGLGYFPAWIELYAMDRDER